MSYKKNVNKPSRYPKRSRQVINLNNLFKDEQDATNVTNEESTAAKHSMPVTTHQELIPKQPKCHLTGINKELAPVLMISDDITKHTLTEISADPAHSEKHTQNQSCDTYKPATPPKRQFVQSNQTGDDSKCYGSISEATTQDERPLMNSTNKGKMPLTPQGHNHLISTPKASQEQNMQTQGHRICLHQEAKVHIANQILTPVIPSNALHSQMSQQNVSPKQLHTNAQAFEDQSKIYAQENINPRDLHEQHIIYDFQQKTFPQVVQTQENICAQAALFGRNIGLHAFESQENQKISFNAHVQTAPPIYKPHPIGDTDLPYIAAPQPESQTHSAPETLENLALPMHLETTEPSILRTKERSPIGEGHDIPTRTEDNIFELHPRESRLGARALHNRKRRQMWRFHDAGSVDCVKAMLVTDALNSNAINEALQTSPNSLSPECNNSFNCNAAEFIPGLPYEPSHKSQINDSITGFIYSAPPDLHPPNTVALTYNAQSTYTSRTYFANNTNVSWTTAPQVEDTLFEPSQDIFSGPQPSSHVKNIVNPSDYQLFSLLRKGEDTMPSTIDGPIGMEPLMEESIIPHDNPSHDLMEELLKLSAEKTITTGHTIMSFPGPSASSIDQCLDPNTVSRPLLNMDQSTIGQHQHIDDPSTIMFESASGEKDELTEMPIVAITKNPALVMPTHKIFVSPRSVQRLQTVVDLNLVPPSIRKLYNLVCEQFSDYAFVYALSAQLCQECVPMECYVYFKMTLLASLNSFEPDELRAPISLFVICYDTYMANTLMYSIGNLATRIIGPHDAYQLQQQHIALPARCNWLTASPLNLAQQGVYYVGDWNRLPSEQVEELENCIENSAVPVQQSKTFQLLESAVWTYWQPEHAKNASTVFAKFCPIFGLPIFMENNEAQDKVLFETILQQHGTETYEHKQDAFNIPNDDMRALLSLLYERRISFTNEAQNILQKYYIVSRMVRPTIFTSKTYIVLKQLSEAIAKLSMRVSVVVSDVVVTAFLSEYYIQAVFGASNNPPPAVPIFKVISEIDPFMNEFSRWFFAYLESKNED